MSMETVIIDDDKIICFLHKKLCDRSGMESVQIFTDPVKAVDHLQKGAASGKDFLVLLDINMPEMNGWEVLAALDKANLNGSKIDVIMVTSSIDDADLQRSKKFDRVCGFVTKPLNLPKLKSITDRETFLTLL